MQNITGLTLLVRELAAARLIARDGRNVRLTEIGRRRVQAKLEQRLQLLNLAAGLV